MTIHQKTVTVEHAGNHAADEKALKAAVAAEEGVPEGWAVKSSVNESGKQTKYVIIWDDEAADQDPPADPAPPAAGDDGTPESTDPARAKVTKK